MTGEGTILTNAHVVAGADEVEIVLPDGSRRDAAVLGRLAQLDVALLEVEDPSGLQPVALGESSELVVGDDVVAVGNALNLGATPTVTTGIVSALNRTVTTQDGTALTDLIQTDAAINPGNSGGALLDSSGRLVGINTAVAGNAENIGFAIAIDAIEPLLEDLRAGSVAFLGVASVDASRVPDAVLERFGVDPEAQGALVAEVEGGSPAASAGLEPGDLIVGFGGAEITSSDDLVRAIVDHDPGATVEIDWLRGGEETTEPVELAARDID